MLGALINFIALFALLLTSAEHLIHSKKIALQNMKNSKLDVTSLDKI